MDYNFVSVEEFFSLEESGALLESGKFKGQSFGFMTLHLTLDTILTGPFKINEFILLHFRLHMRSFDTGLILTLYNEHAYFRQK